MAFDLPISRSSRNKLERLIADTAPPLNIAGSPPDVPVTPTFPWGTPTPEDTPYWLRPDRGFEQIPSATTQGPTFSIPTSAPQRTPRVEGELAIPTEGMDGRGVSDVTDPRLWQQQPDPVLGPSPSDLMTAERFAAEQTGLIIPKGSSWQDIKESESYFEELTAQFESAMDAHTDSTVRSQTIRNEWMTYIKQQQSGIFSIDQEHPDATLHKYGDLFKSVTYSVVPPIMKIVGTSPEASETVRFYEEEIGKPAWIWNPETEAPELTIVTEDNVKTLAMQQQTITPWIVEGVQFLGEEAALLSVGLAIGHPEISALAFMRVPTRLAGKGLVRAMGHGNANWINRNLLRYSDNPYESGIFLSRDIRNKKRGAYLSEDMKKWLEFEEGIIQKEMRYQPGQEGALITPRTGIRTVSRGKLSGESYVPIRLYGGFTATLITPTDLMIEAPPTAKELFGLDPIHSGLNSVEKGTFSLRIPFTQTTVPVPTPFIGYRAALELGQKIPGGSKYLNIVSPHPMSNGMGNIRNRNLHKVSHASTGYSREWVARVARAFDDIRDDGSIPSLHGIDRTLVHLPTVGIRRAEGGVVDYVVEPSVEASMTAPFIADVAARLPTYWKYLNTDQKEVMMLLKAHMQRFNDGLIESGMPVERSRIDIILSADAQPSPLDIATGMGDIRPGRVDTDTFRYQIARQGEYPMEDIRIPFDAPDGFYIPRGSPRVVQRGVDVPVLGGRLELPRPKIEDVGINKEDQMASYRKTESFQSQAQGVIGVSEGEKVYRWRYPSFREALRAYFDGVGRDLVDSQAGSFFKAQIDPYTGYLRSNLANGRVDLKISASRDSSNLITKATKYRGNMNNIAGENIVTNRNISPDSYEMNIVDKLLSDAIRTNIEFKDYIRNGMRFLRTDHLLTGKAEKAVLLSMSKADELLLNTDLSRVRWKELGQSDSSVFLEKIRIIDSLHKMGDDFLPHVNLVHEQNNRIRRRRRKNPTAVDPHTEEDAIQMDLSQQLEAKGSHLLNKSYYPVGYLELQHNRINRILRGEIQVPGIDINAMQRRYNQSGSRNQIDILQNEYAELAAPVNTWTKGYDWEAGMPRVRQTPLPDYDIIPLPGLEGLYFPDELAQSARTYILHRDPYLKSGQADQIYEGYNSFYQGIRATGDHSSGFIQLQTQVYKNPRKWGRVMHLAAMSWGGEHVVDKMIMDFADKSIRKQATEGLRADQPILTPGQMGAQGLAIQLSDPELSIGRGIMSAVATAPVFKQANRAFGTALTGMRMELMAEAQISLMKETGQSTQQVINSGKLGDLARGINNMTGWSTETRMTSLAKFIQFAPRWFASRVYNLGRVAAGTPSIIAKPMGMEGPLGATVSQRMAAKAFWQTIAFGSMFTILLNAMQGHTTDLDPFVTINEGTPEEEQVPNSNMMAVRLFGQDLKILGPHQMFFSMLMYAGSGDIMRILRNQGSGVVSNLFSVLTGEDGIGNPIGTGGPGESSNWMRVLAYYANLNLTPFIAQDADEPFKIGEYAADGDYAKALGQFGLTSYIFHGGNAADVTPSEKLAIQRQEIGREMLDNGEFDAMLPEDEEARRVARDMLEDVLRGSSWDGFPSIPIGSWKFDWASLPSDVQNAIDKNPHVFLKLEEVKESYEKRGGLYNSYRTLLAARRNTRTTILDSSYARNGFVPNKAFRTDRRTEYDAYFNYIEGLESGPGMADELARRDRKDPKETDLLMLDVAVNQLMQLRQHPDLQYENGRYDFEEARRREDLLEDKWKNDPRYGSNMMDRVNEYIRKNQTQGEQDLQEMRNILKPWFEIPENVASRFFFDRDKAWNFTGPLWQGDFYSSDELGILRKYIAGRKQGENPTASAQFRNQATQAAIDARGPHYERAASKAGFSGTIINEYHNKINDVKDSVLSGRVDFPRKGTSNKTPEELLEQAELIEINLLRGEYKVVPEFIHTVPEIWDRLSPTLQDMYNNQLAKIDEFMDPRIKIMRERSEQRALEGSLLAPYRADQGGMGMEQLQAMANQ